VNGRRWRRRALAIVNTVLAVLLSAAALAAPAKDNELAAWDAKWIQVQSGADRTDWIDHFRVCAIKFRYRNYDQLFRCLTLFEAKIAKDGIKVKHGNVGMLRRAAPVLTGWLRAAAYTELGEPEQALKWAEAAWDALPEDYRQTKQSWLGGQVQDEFSGVALAIGGYSMRDEEATFFGKDNPAGLDLRGETIAMGLAAQRALLYARAGNKDQAKIALANLQKWESIRLKDSWIGLFPTAAPFKIQAQLLSLGPLYALGEYTQVVRIYDDAAAETAHKKHRHQLRMALTWIVFLPQGIMYALDKQVTKAFTAADARLFAVAIEDTANALVYAESLARTNKTNEARAKLDSLLELPELRAMGSLYWATLYQRGLIALHDGKRAEAIQYLTQSIAAIESVRSTISFEAAKIGFAGDKQAVYAALVSALADQGDWNAAFLIAERAKARSLVDLLAQRRDLAAPPSADDKVRALFAQAATVDAAVGLPDNEGAVRGITVVAESRAALSEVAPAASSLVSAQQVSIANIAGRMPAGESLVDYFRTGDDLYALVLNGTAVKGYKLSAAGLDDEVRAFRDAIERRDAKAADLGRPLFDRLIRPLAAGLTGDKLTISPHGVLHYLPFVALMDGDQYLLDRFSLRLIPSAATLTYIRSDHATKLGRLLALGNPDLGNSSFDLPNAQVEAINVAALFPDSRALVRAEASKSAVRELGSGFAMLHFATHGKFNADAPLNSGLYLAKGQDADGVLTVGDLYGLHLDSDLVTLSACETGLGKVANGDDVIGLTRGFLYAGARSIVASLWEVDDAATEQLMVNFYGNLKDHDKREALRLAQIETRAKFPHPMFWAAFQIVGRAD
jgi:CHAT domain-containing protein